MRKQIFALTLVSLFTFPLASFAGTSSGWSEQSMQGTSQAATSSGVSSSRLYEEQPPLAKDAYIQSAAPSTSGGSSSSNSGTNVGVNSDNYDVHSTVQNYVWKK